MEGEVLAALIGAGASLFVAALTLFDSRRGRKSQDKHLSAELGKFKAETEKLALETDELRRRPKEAEQKRNLRLLSKFLEPLRQTLEQNCLIFNGLIGERGALEYHPKRLREYFSSLPPGLLSSTAKSAAVAPESVYTRVGVRPFINLTAAYTINGGLLTLPEVKAAMDDASRYSVNIDELMEKVGERIASLLGAEAAIVTAGCAAALTHATARHVWLEPIRKDATAAQAAGLKGSGDHAAGLTERICIGTNGFSGR